MRVNREKASASQHRGPLVGELSEVLVISLLLPLGDLDQVAALVVRRGQLHTLPSELGVKVPCVRVIDDLRLERRGYPLLLQVCPINAVEKRVCFDS